MPGSGRVLWPLGCYHGEAMPSAVLVEQPGPGEARRGTEELQG